LRFFGIFDANVLMRKSVHCKYLLAIRVFLSNISVIIKALVVEMQEFKKVPIIDLFAGPGGLGEGFSAYDGDKLSFKINLSIEKEYSAVKTLALRKFFRKFPANRVPDTYYHYVTGDISADELFAKHQYEAGAAYEEAWLAELGSPAFPDRLIDRKIRQALDGAANWVLLGGPPCQAYSLVGRSRMINTHPDFKNDHRHFLYRQYLRIIKEHSPSVFIMENVKGLLSSRHDGNLIFEKIREDLSYPWGKNSRDGYQVFSLSAAAADAWDLNPSDFIIRSENYGVPQARHRVILIGIRNDCFSRSPSILEPAAKPVSVRDVIEDLPKLRSAISRDADSYRLWRSAQRELLKILRKGSVTDRKLIKTVREALADDKVPDSRGELYIRKRAKPFRLRDWLYDPRLGGVLNHEARSHMSSDLRRYMFCAVFAKVYERSPKLHEFPREILPAHKNALYKSRISGFADRFRVQGYDSPATTIVSHISKDGHYYIHPDPAQCRSLTVREAARIQTFPDNYFFEGNRTQQYVQVGNAVPPYLAYQIAGIVEQVIINSAITADKKVRRVG
jgi:DNA (cytosine-5)-methyltransferase 1